ncbi:MAG TPA: hypothetical protein VF017_04025 [Thermoanaerobaculia bacterium]|nr:hypothetical protein [Thermoanaerobaculia bacterium]
MRVRSLLAIALTALASAGPALAAGTAEVRLLLPQRAKIELAGKRTVALAPFLVVSQEGSEGVRGRNIDVQKEFERYLFKVLRRDTDLKVLDLGVVDYPVFDSDRLAREQDFWAALGERSQADLILAGSLDFDIQDRTGYRTEDYTLPFDGRTYQRQVLVEQTGFEYDILMQVFDGRTGTLLYTDNFKDFQNFEGEDADPLKGMFENLYALEDRIVNIFVQKSVESARVLFTE